MRCFKQHLWNIGMASVGMVLLLTCLTLIPLSAASAHEGTSGVATPTTVTVQVTPTEDATVTALNKEKLEQEVNQLKNQNFWSSWTNLATPFSILVALVAASFGAWRWRVDRQHELEKRAEERFLSAVTGLGDEREGARVGAAILLRTFLQPGYEQFYRQVFDLAVVHLRLRKADPGALEPVDSLSQALITVFREAFPLARNTTGISDKEQKANHTLDATCIQLDHAYLRKADLKQVRMPQASLRKVDLKDANLRGANLFKANLCEASLTGADLVRANLIKANLVKTWLRRANLSEANLHKANLSEANLSGTNFNEADLSGAILNNVHLEDTLSLKDADLRGVKGLTKEQLAACKAKGAIVDEDATISSSQSTVAPSSPPQSNDPQTPSVPSIQGSTPPSDPNEGNTGSSKSEPES